MIRVVGYRTARERAAAGSRVAAHLEAGGIVAYPTETVYGLGCTLRSGALEALAAFKGDRPFLVLIRNRDDTSGLEWTPDAQRLADAFWPGPLTLALTAEPERYPRQVVGPDGAVAVRVSPHPAIADLLDAAGRITSTSANRPGRPPARDGVEAAAVAAAVAETGGRVVVLDGGRLPEARPSTIVRCGATTRVIREGAISRTDLATVVDLE